MLKWPKRRKRLLIGFTLVLVIVASLGMWGPLFAFSPLVVGFHRVTLSRCDVYFHDKTDAGLFANADELITEVEAFHRMQFPRRVQIIVCCNAGEYARLTTNHLTRFVTFPLYGRIFVSHRAVADAKAGRIHLDVYLKHELSHALLFQQMPLTRVAALPVWLREGLAVYSAGQLGVDQYLSDDAVRTCMQQGDFLHPDDFGHLSASHMPSYVQRQPALVHEPRFWYAESGCMVGDLIERYGKTRFLHFVQLTMYEGAVNADFQRVFGCSFAEYVNGFRQRWSQSQRGNR